MHREQLYILRIWSDSNEGMVWRASLENMRTKEKTHFGSLEELQAFFGVVPDEQKPRSSRKQSEC